MKITRFILPVLAVGGAAVLIVPEQATGFSTLGHKLNLFQRDVRVYNNFSKPQTNNNTIPDANWPGYDGAELAIWKACQEWQSELFGNGSGDPHQNFGLGSGGANFEPTWQGNATGVGTPTDNTHSQIGGSNGGVLAFMEGPGSTGWRIRYYETWNWQDGPGTGEGGIDLQGVACHEYGHALGLGHSGVAGATMRPSITGSGISQRSIHADDIAGVQFIYGTKNPLKPRILSVSTLPGLVTLTGNNFDPNDNEVWFTQAGAGGTGDPVVVAGLGSTAGGTVINLVPPVAAGPGAVHVRLAGSAGSKLSNGMPITPLQGPPCTVTIYCTGKVNSNGIPASMSTSGTPSFGVNDFALHGSSGLIANINGIHFWSDTGSAAIPFANAFLCLQPPTLRGPLHQYDFLGEVTVPIPVLVTDIGNTRWFQFWFRDSAHPDGTGVGLSDAAEVLFCN